MTEPIAVDVPTKSAAAAPRPASLPATLAGAAAAVAASAVLPGVVPLVAALPKIDSPPKPTEPAKPASTPSAAPQAATMSGLLARFTKRQLTIGATAVFSVVAGIGAVRLMFPAKDDPKPDTPTASWTSESTGKTNTPTSPTPAPAPTPPKPMLEVTPAPVASAGSPFTIPVAPATPSAPPSGARPRDITPVGGPLPPAFDPIPPAYMPPAPVTPPVAPGVGPAPIAPPSFDLLPPIPTVLPVSGTDQSKPPASGGGPAIPPLPAVPSGPSGPVMPAAPSMPPAGGMSTPSVFPQPMDLVPTVPPVPLSPPASPAVPVIPVSPPTPPALPIPGGSGNGGLPPIPVGPSAPPALPMLSAAPGVFPGTDTQPKTDPKPAPPNFDPVVPGAPAVFTKPGGTTDVKPTGVTSAPKTDFDVDLYDPKATDTYEAISQEYYNDKRFAAALKAFNRNQPLQGGRLVEVPPIHILRKRFTGQTGSVTPVGGSSVPPSATPDWGPARATGAGADRGVYTVPQGGQTMKAIARAKLGSEQRWQDIWDLNRQYTDPSQVLPAGTELKLPSDAR